MRRVGLSSEAFAVRASGESENQPRPCDRLLALIFARSKQSFRFLLRVPLFMVSDTTTLTEQGTPSTSIEFASPPSNITEFVDAFHDGEEVRFHSKSASSPSVGFG